MRKNRSKFRGGLWSKTAIKNIVHAQVGICAYSSKVVHKFKECITSHMNKIIYKTFTLFFTLCYVLYYVCAKTIQIVKALKNSEHKVQLHDCCFFILNTNIQVRNRCHKYLRGSQT